MVGQSPPGKYYVFLLVDDITLSHLVQHPRSPSLPLGPSTSNGSYPVTRALAATRQKHHISVYIPSDLPGKAKRVKINNVLVISEQLHMSISVILL
jgi:hypothetical protein